MIYIQGYNGDDGAKGEKVRFTQVHTQFKNSWFVCLDYNKIYLSQGDAGRNGLKGRKGETFSIDEIHKLREQVLIILLVMMLMYDAAYTFMMFVLLSLHCKSGICVDIVFAVSMVSKNTTFSQLQKYVTSLTKCYR